MILDEIVRAKREELVSRKSACSFDEMRRRAMDREWAGRSFIGALQTDSLSLIAEIKKASPSVGMIRDDFDVAEIAKSYDKGGAAAISVLTDERFFQGSLDYLRLARNSCPEPILRKDFVIDEYQVAETAAAGADAFLLIAAILSRSQMSEYIEMGAEYGLDGLVEIHDGKELEAAVDAGAKIIGINNRNLSTFEVTLETSFELGSELPDDVIRVSESGIRTRENVVELERLGFHAILIGETLLRYPDPAIGVRELMGEGA